MASWPRSITTANDRDELVMARGRNIQLDTKNRMLMQARMNGTN
jgi:hypothetical protein